MPDEAVTPKGGPLWTTAEIAQAFRVGVSSVKRWADEGELESVRTAGGHRRFTLASAYRFASIRNLATDHLPKLEQKELFEEVPEPSEVSLLDALLAGDSEMVRSLVTPHVESVVQRAAFLDRIVGDSLREIGDRWERGDLGIDVEHRAAHLVTEAVDRLRPRAKRDGALALLACPPGEWHELPLHLVRLVLEWSGWRTELEGAQLPWEAARNAVDRSRPAILAFSARSSTPFHDPAFTSLVAECGARGTMVIAGGRWARGSAREGGYLRFRTLRTFEKWLRTGVRT